MNDMHDNAADDRAILKRFLGSEVGSLRNSLSERYDPVQVVTVYQVSCRICQVGAVDAETFDEYGDAEDARYFHRKMHRGEV